MIYVAHFGYWYEGFDTIGLFKEESTAKAECENNATQRGYTLLGWGVQDPDDPDPAEIEENENVFGSSDEDGFCSYGLYSVSVMEIQ